jgi:hypothetical protein
MKHSAFNGLVEFEVGFRSIKTEMTRDRFKQAVPEHIEWLEGSDTREMFTVCGILVGSTKSITFNVNGDAPEAIVALREFWQLAQNTTDYRAVWEAFSSISTPAYNEWWSAYVESNDRAHFLAPPELQPGVSPETDEGKAKKK